jgi:hypothetical protein
MVQLNGFESDSCDGQQPSYSSPSSYSSPFSAILSVCYKFYFVQLLFHAILGHLTYSMGDPPR